MQVNLTPVVKNLIILNVIMFVVVYFLPLGQLLPDFTLHFYSSPDFKPYQLITHMFMHAGVMHILFNMMGLAFLGPYVERTIGAKNFFILYFACGFAAVAAQYTGNIVMNETYSRLLGASGCVYGVLFSFAVLFPKVKLRLLFPPIDVEARYLAIGLVVFDMIGGVSNVGNIGHFAHLGGGIMGLLLTYFWIKPQLYKQ